MDRSDDRNEMNRKEENGQNVSKIAEIGLDKTARTANNARKEDDSNGKEREEGILYGAAKYFTSRYSDNSRSLPARYVFSNRHIRNNKTEVSEEKESTQNYCNVNLDHDIKTFEDALIYFGLHSHLLDLEKSLDQVKNRQKTKEEHEQMAKKIDKEMQKLSLRHHPDKVKNRKGDPEEIEKAEKVQTLLNATRSVLNILSAKFLEEIHIDHQYTFYVKLHMNSLGNENDIKNRVYEVLSKIDGISLIKQQNISEIRKFLIDSKCCISFYLSSNVSSFEVHRDLAFSHLKYCVEGYEKLYLELEEVEKQCEHDKQDNISFVIRQMAADCKRDMTLLKQLKRTAKNSERNYTFFSPVEPMDPYFVLPFVSYVNVIIMCGVMMKRVHSWLYSSLVYEPFPMHNDQLNYLMPAYFVVSYHTHKEHEVLALKVMEDIGVVSTEQLKKDRKNYEVIQRTFFTLLKEINLYMESKFNVDSYVEASSRKMKDASNYNECGSDDITKCMAMMHELRKKNQRASQNIEELKNKAREKLKKCDELMEEAKETNKNIDKKINMK